MIWIGLGLLVLWAALSIGGVLGLAAYRQRWIARRRRELSVFNHWDRGW